MLTDAAIRKAEPREKPYKLSDRRGLYLLVNPNGGKLWRMNYRFDGKQKTLAFGTYPTVSLAQARESRKEAHKLLTSGIDPSMERKACREAKRRMREEKASLKFEFTDTGALLIQVNAIRLLLNSSQANALRAFLDASKFKQDEAESPC
jgi:hypothetical protein